MSRLSPNHLSNLLRETLWSVETRSKVTPNDPVLIEVKRTLLLKIAELEASRNSDFVARKESKPIRIPAP